MGSMLIIPPLFGMAGLLVALLIYFVVLKYDGGTDKVKKIADQIHLGAMVFMRREYSYLFLFVSVLIILSYLALGLNTAIAVTAGAISSSLAGWLGMFSATKANSRTATAAANQGAKTALSIAFYGGSIMGLCVASLGLVGLGGLYFYFGGDPDTARAIEGFGMGASCVALFSRVGGGIFTKSADVGADLVGKIEAGIPEDDPRNPGVIADNVGDNVGDVAGMGSDIFESYCGSMIASIALAASMTSATITKLGGDQYMLQLMPLALDSLGLICSIIGIFMVRLFSDKSPEIALRFGTIGSAVVFIVASFFLVKYLGVSSGVWAAVLIGSIGGIIVGLVTEYYTGGAPCLLYTSDAADE